MVDALASGASVRKDVEVRVLFWAPKICRSPHNLAYRLSMRVKLQTCCRLALLFGAALSIFSVLHHHCVGPGHESQGQVVQLCRDV